MPGFPGPAQLGPFSAPTTLKGLWHGLLPLWGGPACLCAHLLICSAAPTPGLGRSFVCPSLVSFLSFLFLMGCVVLGMFLFLIFLPFFLAPSVPPPPSPCALLPSPGSCPFSSPPHPLLQRTCWRFKGYSVALRPRSLTVAGDYKKAGQAEMSWAVRTSP